jgi:hypothetical protein
MSERIVTNDLLYPTAQETLDTARRYLAVGLSVIPVKTDGSKAPAADVLPKEFDPEEQRLKATWKPFQSRHATEDELQRWSGKGIAIICGAISGSLEVIDNDDPALWDEWCKLVKSHAPGLFDRLVVIGTPRGGHHILYRCATIAGSQKLAQRPGVKDGKPSLDVLWETKGEAGYIIAPGSPLTVHLLRKPYFFIQGDVDSIPMLTVGERGLLLGLAESFDEVHRQRTGTLNGNVTPGDDYNNRGNLESLLLGHGWLIAQRRGRVLYLRKPGKQGPGHQATLNAVNHNVFWCFSTSAPPFEANKPYSAFQCFGLLNHKGDFKAAASDLAAQGYGSQVNSSSNGSKKKATTRPKTQAGGKSPPKPTDDALRDRWLKANPDTIFARDDFYRYQAGLWKPLDEQMVRKEIDDIVCAAKPEGIRPTNSLVSSVYGLAKSRAAIPDSQLDRQTDYLVCRNGVLHIPTRTLGPHRKELYCTTGVDFDYDPSAQAPAWGYYLEWLIQRYGGDGKEVVEFMQEFAGLCITHDMKHEICLWLVGPPGGGKSTFIEGIRAALSDRTVRLGLNEISQRFGLSNLAGKTLATCSEQPSDYLQSTEILNSIISGEAVTVERKYHHPYEINRPSNSCGR